MAEEDGKATRPVAAPVCVRGGREAVTSFGWVALVTGAGVGLVVLDRFLLWAEARGWIYYRRKKASPGTLGSAFLEIQGMLQPGTQHVVEELRKEDVEADEVGDPPE
jgi:hypothetical protein